MKDMYYVIQRFNVLSPGKLILQFVRPHVFKQIANFPQILDKNAPHQSSLLAFGAKL